MNLPFFDLVFRTHLVSVRSGLLGKRRPLAVMITNNYVNGLICTIYYKRAPVFNLVMDKGKACASPQKHEHEWFWGNVRWSVGSGSILGRSE